MTYYNDVDIEMIEIAEAARTAAAGVCPICEEAVDPFHPKWKMSAEEAESIVKCYGPHGTYAEGYHDRCLTEERW